MKVTNKSFGYRVLDFWDHPSLKKIHRNDSSYTLCRYFWDVVGAICLIFGVIILFVVVLAAILCGLYVAVVPFLVSFGLMGDEFGYNDIIVSNVFIVVYGIGLMIWGLKIKIKINRLTPMKTNQNLFVSYIKAKKQKVCPIIEFKRV